MKENIKNLVKKRYLSRKEERALNKLITEIRGRWPGAKLKLFGSKVTGEFDEESDVDILIVLPGKVSQKTRKQIIGIVFEINLEVGSNISPLILSKDEWETGLVPLLPIYYYIEKEGVSL